MNRCDAVLFSGGLQSLREMPYVLASTLKGCCQQWVTLLQAAQQLQGKTPSQDPCQHHRQSS